jgi:hypothetical protein
LVATLQKHLKDEYEKNEENFQLPIGENMLCIHLLFEHKYHEAQLLKAKVKDLQVNSSH